MSRFTDIVFSGTDALRDIAEKLGALLSRLGERLDVNELRVGNTTKLDHNGDVTVGGLTMAEGAAAGYVLVCDADGVASWGAAGTSGAAGNDTEVQYNDKGAFGAEAAFNYDKDTDTLNVDNIVNDAMLTTKLFTMSTDAAVRLILVSDADGVGTWQDWHPYSDSGADKEVTFNDGGATGGESTFTFDKATDILAVTNVDAGDVDTETFNMAPGAGAELVMTSDAGGTGTWQPSAYTGKTGWEVTAAGTPTVTIALSGREITLSKGA